MELFQENGGFTDEGLQAVAGGQLDELGRLEAAEHLSYCDKCMDRYTALLTADVLETPPKGMKNTVMTTLWVRLMQNTYGRVAVASVAAVLALNLWRSGALEQMLGWQKSVNDALLSTQIQQTVENYQPKELGRPVEIRPRESFSDHVNHALEKLLPGKNTTDTTGGETPKTR